MARDPMAGAQKKAYVEGFTIVCVDEAGFYLLPGVARTYAPRGHPPILRPVLTRDHLSVMSGITMTGNLYTMVRRKALTSADSVVFLTHLLRHIRGNVLVIWDGSPMHRGDVRTFLAEGGATRLHVEQLPPYAPDLNPDEGVWQYLKNVAMRNLCCLNLKHLHRELTLAITRLRRQPHLIQACFGGLDWASMFKFSMQQAVSDGERKTLAEIGKKLGKQALEEVASIVKPDTILAWQRKLAAQKFDGSQRHKVPGRPKIDAELEALVVRMAQENRSWGYDRIVGALQHLGYTITGQTVGNILKRHGIAPAPERKKTTTWNEFIRSHLDVLVATDFFTAEVWTWCGLITYYILFFIRLGTREVCIAGLTPHPNAPWMVQVARNVTMTDWGFLTSGQYLLHDKDGKFCPAFQRTIDAAGVQRVPLPPRSPDLNAYAERWVRSVKEEALSRLIVFGERSLSHVLTEYMIHYHHERPHQGKGNVVLMPSPRHRTAQEGPIRCRERLGGLLKYYDCEAA